MTEPTKITVLFHGSVTLLPDEVWPDGDVPEKFAAEEVAQVMEDAGKRVVLTDWNLIEDLRATVTVPLPNSSWSGDDVMFGEAPPRWVMTKAEVWE